MASWVQIGLGALTSVPRWPLILPFKNTSKEA